MMAGNEYATSWCVELTNNNILTYFLRDFPSMIVYLLFSMAVILGAELESDAKPESGTKPKFEARPKLGDGPELDAEPTKEELLLLSAIERDNVDEVSKLLNVVGINTYINSVTSLLYALELEREKIAEFFIANDGLIVDQVHKKTGETALLAAIRFEVYSCVPLLLRKGASIRATGLDKMNVLHYVALYGGERRSMDETLQLLKSLLDEGAVNEDILDGRDYREQTPLLTVLGAEKNFKPYVAEELMNAGCDVTAEDASFSNVLHYAGRYGRVDIMSKLLSNAKAKHLVHSYNIANLTPLLYTLAHEGGMNLRVVEYLVEAGAKDEECDRGGNNALQIAVRNKRTHIVSYLLNRKFVDPCVKNNKGETAISIAAVYADGEMMKILLEEGTDKCVDDIDEEAETPLMRSLQVSECQLGVVELLVNAGARLGIRDLYQNSILHLAASTCGKEVVTFLLQKMIEKEKESFVKELTDDNDEEEDVRCKVVNCRNIIEETPLMSAVSNLFGKKEPSETLEVVKALVEHGAEVNAINAVGESALRYAIKNGYADCALYLLEQNADAAVLDEDGNTLFHVGDAYLWTRDLVQALAKAGTPLNAWNNDGETAITDTLKRDLSYLNGRRFYVEENTALYEHIIVAGADINKYNRFGEYPLQLAVNHSHVGLTKLFLRYKAFTEVRNDAKDTPLLAVIKRKPWNVIDWNIVEALVHAEADVHAKNAEQLSAIDIITSRIKQTLQADKENKNEKE